MLNSAFSSGANTKLVGTCPPYTFWQWICTRKWRRFEHFYLLHTLRYARGAATVKIACCSSKRTARMIKEMTETVNLTNNQQEWCSCQLFYGTRSSGRTTTTTTTTKDCAGIQMDMRPQELTSQGCAPHQICGTYPMSRGQWISCQ